MNNDKYRDEWTNSAELQQIEKYGGFYVGRFEAGTSKVTLQTSGLTWEGGTKTSGFKNTNYKLDKIAGIITEKPGEIPFYCAYYETAYAMSAAMYNNEYVYSGLTTGTMWDMIVDFVSTVGKEGNYSDVKSTPWGNYSNTTLNGLKGRYLADNKSDVVKAAVLASTFNGKSRYGILTTASTEEVKKKNMYDLAGNLWELTQEAEWRENIYKRYSQRGGSYFDSYTVQPICHTGGLSIDEIVDIKLKF